MAEPTDPKKAETGKTGNLTQQPAAENGKLTEKQAIDRYNNTLDAETADYNAAAEGTDEVTEAYRELLRRKYARAEEDKDKAR